MDDPHRVEDGPGVPAAFGLPGVALPEVAAVADEEQQRDPVEHGARQHGVQRGEEPVVLHERRRSGPGEVGAHGDPDGLVLLGDFDHAHPGVGFECP